MNSNDPNFQRWLDMVVPTPDTKNKILTGVDWNTVLQILMDIFQIVMGLGCIAKAQATKRTKKALSLGLTAAAQANLQQIRWDLQNKNGIMKLFVLFALLLPGILWAQQQKEKNHHFSAKYRKHFYFGLKKHEKKMAPELSRLYLKADVKVPNDFSMLEKWPLPCGVFDQGQCGSCVYNSITQNYQYSLSIRKALPPGTCPLSREQLMNCIPNGGQCDGDYAENVGGGLVGLGGLVQDSPYPYTASNGSCKSVQAKVIGPVKTGVLIDNSPASMGKAMVLGVPVSITVGADNNFMDYENGVYTDCTRQSTNHEVLLVGIHCKNAAAGSDGYCNFAAAKPGDIVYDVLNSWGESWGDKGVIHMVALDSRGHKCNNVADEAYVLDTGLPVPSNNPVSCSVEVNPKSVEYGGTVSFTVTSVNAVSAVVDGQSVNVPKGNVTETAAPGGDLPQMVNILAFVKDQDGKSVACTGDTSYQVTSALPVPPPTPPAPAPVNWWAVGGSVLGVLAIAIVSLLFGRKQVSK